MCIELTVIITANLFNLIPETKIMKNKSTGLVA